MKKIFRVIAFVLIVTMMSTLISGCGKELSYNTEVKEKNESINVIDMAGNNIVFEEYPNSIFCQSSMYEQIVLALGAESLLRASSYSRNDDVRNVWFQTLYPQIMDVEPAGGDQNGITNELLVSYELDLMFVGDQEQYEEFVNLGIPCVVLEINSLEDLLEAIQIVGQCLGITYQKKAEDIVEYGENLLELVNEKNKEISEKERITAYFMESRYAASEPTLFMTWGADSFQANCLKTVGIDTVGAEFLESGVRAEISTEQLLLSDPDVIVIGGFYEQMNYDALLVDEELKTLSAVKERKIYRVPVGVSEWTRIGVESLLLPLWYGSVFYPELYSDVDINVMVKDFYQNVMGIELKEEYQTRIMAGMAGPGNE